MRTDQVTPDYDSQQQNRKPSAPYERGIDNESDDDGSFEHKVPDGDAELAASLQKMENEQAAQAYAQNLQNQEMVNLQAVQMAQQALQQQGQQQVVVVQMQQPTGQIQAGGAVPVNQDPTQPAGTFKDWYKKSIKEPAHNKCSCGVGTLSAYNAIVLWLFFDLINNILQIFISLIMHSTGGNGAVFFVFWIIIGVTNCAAYYAVNNLVEQIIIVKEVAWVLGVVLFGIEAAFVHEDALIYVIVFVAIYAILVLGFAVRDTYKIFKWIKYYKNGGPYVPMLP